MEAGLSGLTTVVGNLWNVASVENKSQYDDHVALPVSRLHVHF